MEFMVLFQSMFFALSAIKYKSGMCIFSYDYWFLIKVYYLVDYLFIIDRMRQQTKVKSEAYAFYFTLVCLFSSDL